MGNTKSSPIPEDIIIMRDVQEVAKFFVRENEIIWYDPKINSTENASYLYNLRTISDVKTFTNYQEATQYLQSSEMSCHHVITSGTNGESFVKEISNLPNISSIYVFCRRVDYHKKWAKQYPKVLCVESEIEDILAKCTKSMMEWQRGNSAVRFDLPAFAPIFDDMHKSENVYLHLYLKGFVNFQNRKQSKKDFLTLAKALYPKNNKYIVDFEKNYNEYKMESILQWYTEECFLYKLTNNCLRIANSDSIQYCRLILRDLEAAIKQKYHQQSKHYNGLLYRGAHMSAKDWTLLQENIGKDIEMYGFLSTAKQKNVAVDLVQKIQKAVDKKALITIIVPDAPDRGEQGFAEMKEYSMFPDEEEVLFNVRSRFTILEASTEDLNGIPTRHLVLLYGAQQIRKYTKSHNPTINIQVENTENISCSVCQTKIDVANESMLMMSLHKTSSQGTPICNACFHTSKTHQKRPILFISPAVYGKAINLKAEGFVMSYKRKMDIPFYGYRCTECLDTKLSRSYKCITCQGVCRMYCANCFVNQNDDSCLKKGHMIVLENVPFSFWSEKMSEEEFSHLEYQQKSQLKTQRDLFQQAEVFYQAHNYQNAIEYYKKFLERNNDPKSAEVGTSYNNLGVAYNSLGEYQKAVEFHLQSLEIRQSIFGDEHPDTALSYHNLGVAYSKLGEYQKAVEFYLPSLIIRKSVLGDTHPDTTASYNSLEVAYYRLGEYQKALELYLQSLEISKSVFGDKHPDTAGSYTNLGNAYYMLGEYQKAVEFYLPSLEIRKSAFGDKHPDTAASYNNLGNAYYKLGQYQKAVEFHLQSLEIRKSVFGDKHPDTALSYNNLGNAYYVLGDCQKAVEFHLQSLEIRKSVFGDKNPNTAASYSNLGNAYCSLQEYQKALDFHSKAVEIRKATLGDKHLDVASSCVGLGNVYNCLGEHQKAIDFHMQSLEIRKSVFGVKHPDIAGSYHNLATVYKSSGDYQKAVDFCSQALEIYKLVLGDDHPKTLETNNLLQLTKEQMEGIKLIS